MSAPYGSAVNSDAFQLEMLHRAANQIFFAFVFLEHGTQKLSAEVFLELVVRIFCEVVA